MPAECALKFVFAGDEDGGVTGTARRDLTRNFASGDFFSGVEDFEDGEAAAISHIEGFAGNSFDCFEGANVGISDIQDVNVVTDTGAVVRWVIGAKDFEVWNNAKSGIENLRNEVSFDAMGLAAIDGCAGSIEITERGEMETGVGAIVGENFLEAELGFAVRIDGILGMILGDGDSVRLAVSGGGGGKDELFYAVAGHGVEKIDAAGDIGGVEGAGLADGFGDEGFARKMHDCVDLVLGEDFLDLGADAEIRSAENGAGRNGGGVAFLKIIERYYAVTAGEQFLKASTCASS